MNVNNNRLFLPGAFILLMILKKFRVVSRENLYKYIGAEFDDIW